MSKSKLQGILEMPGFHGFPSKASIENNQQEVSQPVYKFRRYLTNGQIWNHKGSLPYNPEFNYPEKSKFAFPQSKTSLETGFASNPETIMFPNPDAGYKLNPEFKDAYYLSFKQREIAHDKERRERGHLNSEIIGDVTTNFVKEYMHKADTIREAEQRAKLQKDGFTEEEINEFFRKRETAKMDYIVDSVGKIDAVVDFMKGFDPDTGMDAAGIGASSVVQNPLVSGGTETPAARGNRIRQMATRRVDGLTLKQLIGGVHSKLENLEYSVQNLNRDVLSRLAESEALGM
jgi:hypothetical protein